MPEPDKPLVLITGAAGGIGSALAAALVPDYAVIGMDQAGKSASVPLIDVDLTSWPSVHKAFEQLRQQHGGRLASVVHLAAYFDFTGEEHPLYEKVNVQGTAHLMRALQRFEVEQFVYAGTMLVHAPGRPGQRIDEDQAIEPRWAYPRSKAAAEAVIREQRGDMPVVLLHLAGIYGEQHCVPTLAHQIARIYERDLKSYLYAGDPRAGQSLLHQDDMVDAFRRTVDRRHALPPETVLLIGEPEAPGYDELQDEIGRLIHGEAQWTTLRLPKPPAKLGALLEEKLEPVIPDAVDHGEKPFIRPFMIEMADDHYAPDIGRARRLLGWEPRHHIRRRLPDLVAALKRDPAGWYRANGITPPDWVTAAQARGQHPDALRTRFEDQVRAQHRQGLWAPFFNIALGVWLMVQPLALGTPSRALAISDVASGALLTILAAMALSWRLAWARWACAAIGLWLMSAPLLFWAPTAAGYLNDTLVGMWVIGLAVGLPPEPGVSPAAALTGPTGPPGWSFNPSSWTQRVLIIALAFVGLHISRYLAAYQLGHIGGVWDPFFQPSPGGKNGTESVITSSVSQAWPVPDAGLGALTYALEILTGVIGSQRRWRTMPWLVLLFGLMIVPLGAVSIFFIIIQPIWIGTWCTLCLIAALAMLVQMPYSLDELVATGQFLQRRRRAGRPLLQVLFTGDTDDGGGAEPPAPSAAAGEFDRPPGRVLRDVVVGGVGLPWHLAACMAIGLWLMGTRLTLGAQGGMADADHLVGSLVMTISVIACAEVARPLRWLNAALGAALLVTPFVFPSSGWQTALSVACGLALAALSVPRGPVRCRYGTWDRFIR